jgi:cytochrome c oxidase subunit 3
MSTYEGTSESIHRPAPPITNAKLGMILFLCSEVMLFVGLLAGYVVLRFGNENFVGMPDIPVLLPGINTGVIVLSSLALIAAVRAFHASNRSVFGSASVLSLVLATLFLLLQIFEWLRVSGSFGPDAVAAGTLEGANLYSSMFYLLSGVHALHVLGGLFVLAWLVLRAVRRGTEPMNQTPVTAAQLYWHFVTVVWLTVFVMIFIIR